MARRGENIYKRKDGRYEGRYIKGRKEDGKPLFGYVYAYSYAEVKAALEGAKAVTRQNGPVHIIGRGSLKEFLCHWLKHTVSKRVKSSTYAQYHDRVFMHIIPALGTMAVCRLGKEDVQGFVKQLSDKGLAPSTVSNISGVLFSAMKNAVRLRAAVSNPCEDIEMPQPEIKELRALSKTEQIRLEQMLPGCETGLERGVLLALYTGLRIGEICALRWRDVDLPSGILTVRCTLQRSKNFSGEGPKTMLIEGVPKSKRSLRAIPIPPDLTKKLITLRGDAPDIHYVLSDDKTPIEPRTLRARFRRIAAKAGLDIPFHCLRHTFATRCLELNFDVQTLSELLGHAEAGTTLRVYAHSVFDHKRMLTSRLHILSEGGKGRRA